MNANRKSDEFVVPATSANKDAAEASAESTEERNSTKRNAGQATLCRTQRRATQETVDWQTCVKLPPGAVSSNSTLNLSKAWRSTLRFSMTDFAPDLR